jgi:colanic acid/amylovoran biosynthesis protein
MKVGILNAYDARNLGDQAIVRCTIEWLLQTIPECTIIVFSHHFESNQKFFREVSARPVGWMPPSGGALRRLIAPALEIARFYLGHRSLERECFENCDFYVLCGGGYLYSSKAPLISRNLLLACWQGLAVPRGTPLILFPQSIGPLSKAFDRLAVRLLCKKATALMPRCDDSFTTLIQWGFGKKTTLVPDIVLAMRELCPSYYLKDSPKRYGMGIAAINLSFVPGLQEDTSDTYLKKLEEAAFAFHHSTGEPIRLYVQVGISGLDDDRAAITPLLTRLLERAVPVEVVDTEGNLAPYIASLAENRVFIACRMHACILALTAGTPTIGLAYQPKFFGTFRALSLEEWVKPINSWTSQWLEERIEQALLRNQDLTQEIHKNVESVAKLVLSGLQKSVPLYSR